MCGPLLSSPGTFRLFARNSLNVTIRNYGKNADRRTWNPHPEDCIELILAAWILRLTEVLMFDNVLFQIAAIRIRQRRILAALKEKNILDWDGYVDSHDPEVKKICDELIEDLKLELDCRKRPIAR
jgi:hypothetical protein